MTRREKSLFIALWLLVILVFIISLSGCSDRSIAARNLRKADRAIKKAEQHGAKVDSVIVWKTLEVPVPLVSTDTVFESVEGDTVWIREDRLKIRYIDLPGDTVQIYGECEADTIKIETEHIVTKKISAGYTLWEIIGTCIAVAAVCLLIGMFIQGMRK